MALSAAGTAIVLTTPDANRTFLSYLGEAHALQLSAAAQQAIKSSRMLVVEGYMWEVDDALETLSTAADFARSSGAMVVMTAGDAGVVQRHTADFWQLINDGVDMLFCNRCVSCPMTCCMTHIAPKHSDMKQVCYCSRQCFMDNTGALLQE